MDANGLLSRQGASHLDLARVPGGRGWDDEELVRALIDDLAREAERVNRAHWSQAALNTAWYRGHQEVFWNETRGELMRQPNPFHRVRLKINLMAGLIDSYVAKLGADKLELACEPASDDLQDFDSAYLRTKVLAYYQRALKFAERMDDVDLSMLLTGEAFLKVLWDPAAGAEFDVRPADVGLDAEQFARRYGRDLLSLRPGDVALSYVPTFNLHYGPTGAPFEEAEYVLECYERSKAYVQEHYGVGPDELNGSYGAESRLLYRERSTVNGAYERPSDPEAVVVRALWVRPFARLKGLERGRYVVLAGERVLRNGPNPYDHQRIPIVRFALRSVPEQPQGETFVTDLVPPQADFNRTVSQFAENRELVANPVWLVAAGSVVDEKEWNSKPGGIRRYQGGQKPELNPGQAMPNAVLIHLQGLWRYMQEIAGLRDPSQGRNPPGVRSGRAIALLQEADDQRLGRFVLRRRAAAVQVGELILETLAQFVTEERLVRLGGEESGTETLTFTGAMLRGQRPGLRPGAFDVRVVATGMPQGPAARLEKLDRLMERQWLDPRDPEHRALVFEAIDLGVTRRRIDPYQQARQLQAVRNRRMLAGEYVPPQPYEDLETMQRELNAFRNRPFFTGLDDRTRGLFERYERECLVLMALKPYRLRAIVQPALQAVGALSGPAAAPPAGASGPGPEILARSA